MLSKVSSSIDFIFVFRGTTENQTFGSHSDVPREARIKIKSIFVCYDNAELSPVISSRGICAGGDGVGPCTGDSGGGLFTARGDKWFLRGITSSSLTTSHMYCDVDNPAVFTNIVKFNGWIQDFLNDGDENDRGIDLQCEFTDEWGPYSCDAANLNHLSEGTKIDSLMGDHHKNKGNHDVYSFKIHRGRSKYLPMNVGKFLPNIKKYAVQFSTVEKISRANFEDLQKLTRLEISHGSLEDIPQDAFYDLEDLELLDFFNNQIEVVAQDTFIVNTKLEYLSLSGNNIRRLDPSLLRKNINLHEFRAANNKIEAIHPDFFVQNTNLRNVNFANNQIRSLIASTFRKNSKLMILGFEKNKLQQIDPEILERLNKLRHASFRTNTCINEEFGGGTNSISQEDLEQTIRRNCQRSG